MKFTIVLVLIFLASGAYSQSSPAFDPDVYLPKIGDGIDTVQGHDTSGLFGSGIINLGLGPGSGGFGRIAMQGIPGNEANLTTIKTGHDFDLHHLQVLKKLKIADFHGAKHWGHFRSKEFTDLLIMEGNNITIYWGDSLGNFDLSRRTGLVPPKGDQRFKFYGLMSGAYASYLSSDTCEDILWMLEGGDSSGNPIAFVAWVRGGASLSRVGSLAYPDSVIYIGNDVDPLDRNFNQGDWRGIGRDDLISVESHTGTKGDWHFFRNDPPFRLADFVHSLLYDTIFYRSENNKYGFGVDPTQFSMRALPKALGDSSEDFMPVMGGIYIFRGGKDFGSKHLYMDSAEVVIPNPSDRDPGMAGLDGFGAGIGNCGDMTGTGNPVIGTDGNILMDDLSFYYVLGKAAVTGKYVDMYIYSRGGGSIDSLTGDADSKEDQLQGLTLSSQLWLIHGSNKIPVKLNPTYAVQLKATLASHTLMAYPNPCASRTLLSYEATGQGEIKLSVLNVLGQEVWHAQRHASPGILQWQMPTDMLQNGTYRVMITEGSRTSSIQIAVVR